MGNATRRELEAQVAWPFLPPSEMTTPGYDALHRSAAWLDLSSRAKIAVRGPDRVSFLDGLVSNDVQVLQSGDSCYTFFLNQEGYVLGDAHIVCLPEEILIDTEPELRIKLLRHMERNTECGDVRLEDVTDRVSTLSVEGPHAPEIVARAGFPVPGGQYEFLEMPLGWIGRLNATGQDGFFFFVPSVRKSELIAQMEAAGAVQASDAEMQVVRIERGRPRYGEEITPEYLAQETGLCHALDFQKGPYLGRQVVHDLHTHGCLKKVLVSVDTDALKVAHPHTNLSFGGKECGHLISSVYSPTFRKIVGLAYVQPDFAFTGVQFLSGERMHVRVKSRIDTGIRSCDCLN
ncbi:MAG: glycine cleavage T C-terminal barrel domain-containing protein [Bryobacteraceae bacterium]